MGQDGDVASHDQIEEKLFQLRRHDMVRGFHQHIAGIGKRQEIARLEPGDKIRRHVHIGAGLQLQRNPFAIKRVL